LIISVDFNVFFDDFFTSNNQINWNVELAFSFFAQLQISSSDVWFSLLMCCFVDFCSLDLVLFFHVCLYWKRVLFCERTLLFWKNLKNNIYTYNFVTNWSKLCIDQRISLKKEILSDFND
jgi:hypothetical protein